MKLSKRFGLFSIIVTILFGLVLLSACGSPPDAASEPTTAANAPTIPQPTPLPEAEVTFNVEIPNNTPAGQLIQFVLLDEVTGSIFNSQRYDLSALDDLHYQITLRIPVGSIVKYRYARSGENASAEYMANGQPVHYRLASVDGPGTIYDVISRWSDTPLITQTGRVVGQAFDASNNSPIPGLLVSVEGIPTLTASDGSFIIQGLTPGKHIMIGYALDGRYRTFKQEVIIAAEAATPVTIQVQPAQMVNVTIKLFTPTDTIAAAPVRLAGNLLQLGNTFSELGGSTSVLANRSPQLNLAEDGSRTLILALPAGTDIRYKYTLGDGLWNAEHYANGSFRVRQLIIPEGIESYTIVDQVDTWQSGGGSPIWFDYFFPENTPADDQIYLQFNLFGWTEPIPIWRAESNRWGYRLSSPTNIQGGVDYRFCRNAECSATTAAQHLDMNNTETVLAEGAVESWLWMQPAQPVEIINDTVEVRGGAFTAGVAFPPTYEPSWLPFLSAAYQDVNNLGANTIVLTPTWTFRDASPPNLAQQPGQDMLWQDLNTAIQGAHGNSLVVKLYPQANFPANAAAWWHDAPRNEIWWKVWFERYQTFILHHADLAQSQGIDTLLLGGDWVSPALPGGTLADGSASNMPANAEDLWRNLLEGVRQRYNGQIGWVLPQDQVANPPAFLDSVDEIVVAWTPVLGNDDDVDAGTIQARAGNILDDSIRPIQRDFEKPVILMVAYPSAEGSLTGCIQGSAEECLTPQSLLPPTPDIFAGVNLQVQANAYSGILAAVNQRAWVNGVISDGYFPPVTLQDKSISVHGKPAEQVINYWYHRMLGKE
ncbi:MAG: hypothetical protein JXB38_12285 [Anaerolineales bacterium]|nr:hypothetical protein [Anaerolineales bacterium]